MSSGHIPSSGLVGFAHRGLCPHTYTDPVVGQAALNLECMKKSRRCGGNDRTHALEGGVVLIFLFGNEMWMW
jgi:hypothetical protein